MREPKPAEPKPVLAAAEQARATPQALPPQPPGPKVDQVAQDYLSGKDATRFHVGQFTPKPGAQVMSGSWNPLTQLKYLLGNNGVDPAGIPQSMQASEHNPPGKEEG